MRARRQRREPDAPAPTRVFVPVAEPTLAELQRRAETSGRSLAGVAAELLALAVDATRTEPRRWVPAPATADGGAP